MWSLYFVPISTWQTSIKITSPLTQRINREHRFTVYSKRPVSHQFIFMNVDPSLHQAQFLAGQLALQKLSARNDNNGLLSLIFNMNVRQVMLLCIHE
jgi:hypothetical protein